tara:strand:+ start:31 stop:603 length:573 start_codon:yes stop_codon:yes gene_type:complete
MTFFTKENIVLILFIIHLAVSIFFFGLRWSQDKKVTEEKDLGEEEQITKKNIQTQLFIHSVISFVVCGGAIIYCLKEEDLLLTFNLWIHGPMFLHLVASVAVFFLNLIPDSSLWLSWVFQIVSILVTGFQCLTRKFFPPINWVKNVKMATNLIGTKETKAATTAATVTNPTVTNTAFGKKLLNFGKRKLK